MGPRTSAAAVPRPDAGAAGVSASVGQRVNAERVVLLGWTRAILLQLAHPLIAAGVYDHSTVRTAAPLAAATRLHATVGAMLALTFGTDAERQHALHGIRTIHRRVNGTLPVPVGPFPAGTPYSAEDPALVLWVHLTLLESVPLAYELLVRPLTSGDRDAYCDEAAWVAIALGARERDVPRTWADAQRGLHRMLESGQIAISPQARELAALVLAPRLARLFPPAGWLNYLFGVGLLPATVRDPYGFSWTAGQQRALDRAVPAIRTLRRTMPDVVALWPTARG